MTVTEQFLRRVQQFPDKTLFTFLDGGEEVGGSLTYAELDERARAVAGQLSAKSEPGDRVVLLYEPGLEYIVAFFACLYSGRIAVPVYPPNPQRLDQTLPRLMHILTDASPSLVATTARIHQLAEGLLASMGFTDMKWCSTDEPGDAPFDAPIVQEESLAFLQYTSGSTAKPRGVRVTHRNLVQNVGVIGIALRADPDTVGISWLPLYHDMGLIGKIITPALLGCSSVLMSPLDYLRRPTRWLEAITRFGGTVSAAPNFAYDLCTRKVTDAEVAGLDLSSWEVALNGAEPVQAETLEKFVERFAPAGFRRKAFLPAYGLAESTLMVTGALAGPTSFCVDPDTLEQGDVSEVEEGGRVLVSSGRVPGNEHIVRIVDPEARRILPDWCVGEIWVSGGSIADGYWGRPELSAKTFEARLADDDGRTYLRTGDLGFHVEDELVVTGRRKDLMILRGRNIYPQDVELTVSNAHDAVRPGGMAVFSVDSPRGELCVVVAELERRTRSGLANDYRRRTETLPDWEVAEAPQVDDVAQAIRSAVLADHRVDVGHIVLIRPGSVPKTSSGKIQRGECRKQFLEGNLAEVGRLSADEPSETMAPLAPPKIALEELSFAPREVRVSMLTEYLRELAAFIIGCGVEHVGEQPVMSAGLDSLKAMEFQYVIEEQLGVRLFPSLLLGGATASDVAAELADADFTSAAMKDGLSDPSSEVFSEPSEGGLTETIRFDVDGTFRRRPVDERLSFAEDPDPWGPTPTGEFHLEDTDEELSWNERGFWLYQKTHPQSWAPNIYYAAELPEGTSQEELKSAASRVLARHENLRSRYLTVDGEPIREYDPNTTVELEYVDAIGWSRDMLVEDFERRSAEPFDLGEGTNIRFSYFARDGRPIVYMSMHHIVVDFWSLEQLIRELGSEVLNAEVKKSAVTYADFVSWQSRLLESERGVWCEKFWREELSKGIPKLEFPAASSSKAPSGQGYGRPYRAYIDQELVEAIDAFASAHRATRYTVLLAAYQALLCRWTGQLEFFVGAVAAARTRRFFRSVLGAFSNPLPLRTVLRPEMPFIEHVANTQSKLLSAMDAQEYPLEAMLERLDVHREGVDNPIMQTLFASEQPREGSLEIGASVEGLRTVDLGLAGTIFDFTIMVYQGPRGGEIRLQYNDAKYDEHTVAKLADGFREILRTVVARPDVPVGNLPIVGKTTRGQIATESRGPSCELDAQAIHQLFERQAAQNPERIATVCGEEEWTYGELDRRANLLAHRLRQSGVGPDVPVGVSMTRSPELLATLLGVMKAGGAYVALQPNLPAERLAFMAENSAITTIVCDAAGRSALGALPHQFVDAAKVLSEPGDPGNLDVDVDAENMAYILYTSGTTGRPKGVEMRHGAVVNLLTALQRRGLFGSDDVVLWKTPYGFDVSVSELFNTLAAGGRLVVTSQDSEQDPAELVNQIKRHGVTTLRMVPTALDLLVGASGFEECTSIERVICAGEALTAEISRRFFERSGGELYNLLGATETCIDTTFWHCEPDVTTPTQPVGGPLENYYTHVVSNVLELVPTGLEGDFFVGGASLARGYRGMPSLTAQRFVPDPYSEVPGARMYRTGDRAKWLDDGGMEYLGRADNQLQVRGIRVELLEVEGHLETAPGVRQAAVRAINESAGRADSLVAYVVFEEEVEPTPATLRAHLSRHLADAVIPSQFVRLDAMPRSASGKIDRKALPDPNDTMRAEDRTAPSTPAEQRIAALWRRHLGLSDVGVHENFFEIGGHSLLAVRIQHDVMRTLGVDIPLGMLFDHPTIATLASHLSGTDGFDFVPIERHDYGDEAPLSAGQRLMWIQHILEGEATTYHSPGVFRLRGALDREALARALARLVERHEILRTIYPLQNDEPVQKILPAPDSIEVGYLDLRDADDPETEARKVATEFSSTPFELTKETSFRPLVLQLADEEWVFCLLFHHIAFDEWSVDVLFEEMEVLYRQERGDQAQDVEEARVEDWRQTYEVAYRNLTRRLENGEIDDPTFNIDGWLSSYSGEHYSEQEMREWLQGSMERLEGVELGRTLEIGCGTGMILFEAAPRATEYVALDFSPPALAYIEAVTDQLQLDLAHVELVQGRADELDEIEGEFDTIILNSVAQYFPNHAYFEKVVREACARLRPGGRMYLGDLRDERTELAFHSSVTMRRASETTTRGVLRELTVQRLLQDDELRVSPQFVVQTARGIPGISHVDFTYLRAEHDTEMSLFRFGATLHAAELEGYRLPDEIVHWERDGLTVPTIQEKLRFATTLLVEGFPNARLTEFGRVVNWLNGADDTEPFSKFTALDAGSGFDPDTVRKLGEEAGFRVTVCPSNDAAGVRFDALFERDTGELRDVRPLTALSAQATPLPIPATPSDTAQDLEAERVGWNRVAEMIQSHTQSPEKVVGLPEPALQYADFAIWEQEQFQTTDFTTGIDWWKRHLAGARADVSWPMGQEPGRRRPAGYIQYSWSEEVSDLVTDYAKAGGVSEFVVLYAAFSSFLTQFTGQPDLTIGVGTTLRQRPEFRDLLGYMLNMLPMRSNFSQALSFDEWFQKARYAWESSRPHQWIPVEKIVEALGAERGTGRLALYEVMMAFVPRNHLRRSSALTDDFVREFGDLEIGPFEFGGVADAICSLFVSFFKEDRGIGTEFEYDAGMFEQWQIEQLAQQFEWAVERALRAPVESLATVMLTSGDSSDTSLSEWSRGPRFEFRDQPLHVQFEQWAERSPERPALLSDGDIKWSYGELDQRANRLARHLREEGVRPGTRVGVTVERSPELVLALLGVMKAGATYVAMEPDLPASRLGYIANDAEVQFIVVDDSGRSALGADERWKYVDVRVGLDETKSSEPLDAAVDGSDVVYMLYTSGTTGNPKGVMVPHRSVANHVGWLAEGYGCDEHDVFLLKSSYGFDMSVSELFGPLCLGGTMAIARPGGHRDPTYLVKAVRDFGVTCLRVVPTTLNLLLTEPEAGVMGETLRWVSLGGEALSVTVRDKFYETFVDVELHNPYGITETCVDVTFWECPRDREGQEVSLGRPMGNYDAYALNEWLDPAPRGRVGEIHVGGRGVTYGYWGMPSRTATAFLPNPYGETAGGRMYASGDLGRWNERGELQYQGRKDDQIQLNGIRIEMGEVEAYLESSPGVQQAAVRAVNESEGRAEGLIAYIVPEADAIDVPAIRAYLEENLRRAVIPTRFVVISEMPRRPSGKIDRDALPEPDQSLSGEKAQTDTEERLARIWAQVLEVRDVGRDANFFEVGGTSLRAIKVYRLMQEEFGLEFDVVELFAHPTIEKLAAFIDGGGDAAREEATEQHRRRGQRRRAAANIAARRRARKEQK